MDRASVVSMNASMSERILGAPADPVPEGGYALRVLRTRGRTSGETRSTPLGVVRTGEALYLVSPRAGRDWVRNLDAHPDCETVAGDESARHLATVPPTGEATAAVATYLRSVRAPWALKAFPVPADADEDEDEIAAHLDAMAVRRLDPG